MEKKVLLKTKTVAPVLSKNIVERTALYERLDESKSKTLILVVAPAGFGKTTLINAWLTKKKEKFGWISLDAHDNDIGNFSAYLTQALSKLFIDVGDSLFEKIHNPISNDFQPVIFALLNKICDHEGEINLVFDDYHLIESPDVHKMVEAFIQNASPNLHIYITTRADPPFQLSRLRVSNAISEIRMDNLRFELDETREIIQYFLDGELPEDLISTLWKKTEGWAAGLQLAGLTLREKKDKDAFLKNLSQSESYILDYFFDEVLSAIPADTKEFLFQSALFENFSEDFCNFALNISDSKAHIQYLLKQNIFIFHADDEGEWFRYHRLLRDLLAARFSNFSEHDPILIFSRASRWMEDHNYMDLAVDYAIQSREFIRAVSLIRSEAESFFGRSQFKTVERWLAHIPDEYIDQSPELRINRIWANLITNYDYHQVKKEIRELTRKYPNLSGFDDAVNAFISVSEGDFITCAQYAEKALQVIQDKENYFYTIALWCAGISQAAGKNLTHAAEIMRDLYTLSVKRGNYMIAVMSMSSLAKVHHRMGNFMQAEEFYLKALEIAQDASGNYLPIAGEPLMGLGDLKRESGIFSEAEDDILEGIELSKQWRDVAALEGYLALAKLRFGMHEADAAFNALEKAMELAKKYDATDFDDRIIETQKVKFHFILGNMASVESWVDYTDYASISPAEIDNSNHLSNLLLTREFIFYVRYLLEIGKLDLAEEWINVQIERFEKMNKVDVLIELYLYQAYKYHLEKNEMKTLAALNKCIKTAEKTGFKRLILDLDKKVIALFDRYHSKLTTSEFLDDLFQKPESLQDEKDKLLKHMIEPLTEREMDVLRYLRSNLTTPEIAEQMLLGVNTVRTHIKNIYAKLGVHKRSAAVGLAKKKNIIS